MRVMAFVVAMTALAGPSAASPLTKPECTAGEQNVRRMGDLALAIRAEIKTPEFDAMLARADPSLRAAILEMMIARNTAADALLKLGIAAGLTANGLKRCAE